MERRTLLLVFFLFFISISFGQKDSVLVIIEVSDKVNKEPVQNVTGTFSFNGLSFYQRSSTKGLFQFYCPTNGTLSYSFNHPLYESTKGSRKISDNADTSKWQVEIVPIKRIDLQEVVIKAPGVPDTVYGSKRLSVADFEIQKNGDLILLAYPKQLKKGSELLLYNGQEVVNSFTVPGTAEELVRDYRGNTHVVCKENVYGIILGKEKIGIASLEKEYFLKYLAPILDTNHSKMYFSNFNKDYPEFAYFSYDQMDSTYLKICNIKDDLMMELYRSEYKWVDVRTKLWAKTKELETGIDAEVWVGANYFTQSIYYKELYAPMFHRNDSLFVFDYYKDLLFTYTAKGELLDSVPIYHHYQPKSTGWKKQLIQDRATGQIYAVFDKAGFNYIGRIDTKTGEIKELVRLEFRYVDKIAIHNNFIYYVYRPFESVQKRFLYREKSPYNFSMNSVFYGQESSMETGR